MHSHIFSVVNILWLNWILLFGSIVIPRYIIQLICTYDDDDDENERHIATFHHWWHLWNWKFFNATHLSNFFLFALRKSTKSAILMENDILDICLTPRSLNTWWMNERHFHFQIRICHLRRIMVFTYAILRKYNFESNVIICFYNEILFLSHSVLKEYLS